MEQEVNIKLTGIAIQTTERAGAAFLRALVRHSSGLHINKGNKTVNKSNPEELKGTVVKVKDLKKDDSQVEFVDMGEDELKDFKKYARKYGVRYAMEKHTDPEKEAPTYYIFFRAKDSSLINKAISDYVTDKLRDKDKEESKGKSIKNILTAAKEKSAKTSDKIKYKEPVR